MPLKHSFAAGDKGIFIVNTQQLLSQNII